MERYINLKRVGDKRGKMNRNYQRGRAKEYRLMKILKSRGNIVIRSAGSHSFADLISINRKNKEITFWQVKPKNFSEKKTKEMYEEFSWLEDEFIVRFNLYSNANRCKGGEF